MPNLIIMRDQSGATGKEIIPLSDNMTAFDALMKYFPDGIDPECAQVYIGITRMVLPVNGGEPSPELLLPLTQNMIVVLEVKGLDPLTLSLFTIAGAVQALMPPPPGVVAQRKNSPNNDLQGQTNLARSYQAYPLIFGSPVSYPDLVGEAIIEYNNNIKKVTQLFSVGVGLFDNIEIKAGETPFANFSGATSTLYEPVNETTTIPEVVYAFATNEVDGQQLEGAGAVLSSYSLSENGTGTATLESGVFTFQILKNTDSDTLKSDYTAATIDFPLRVSYWYDPVGPPGKTYTKGTGNVDSMALDGAGNFYTVVLSKFNGRGINNAVYGFDSPFDADRVSASVIGPIRMAVSMQEIWLNFVFNRGLKKDVDIEVMMQQLDGPNGNQIAGPQQKFIFTFTADTLDQQFRTFKGILLSEGYYEFTVLRSDIESDDANKPDDTKLEAVYAINREFNVTHDNLTMLKTELPATTNATSLKENKINVLLTSKLISYSNGVINYTPVASRKMADAILHLTVFLGLDPSTLALDELYEIQDRLDAIDPRLATFDFTFDDIDVSYDERLDAILGVARCYKWLDGDVYRFGRNEKRDFESTVITRRDIVNDDNREYSISYNPQLLQNFDSVKVQYVNKATNKKAYIFRNIDSTGAIVNISGINPKSIELTGCYEEYNAINRAELEIRTLMHQRWSLSDTMMQSAMFLDTGAMVLYAEQYNVDGDVFDGEILAVNGNVATTSEKLSFISGNQYVVNYTTSDGSSVGSFAVTPIANEPFKFSCPDLSQVFVRDSQLGNKIQTGSRYIISTVEELDASRWTVVEKEGRGKNVQLSMVNYDNKIFEYDTE